MGRRQRRNDRRLALARPAHDHRFQKDAGNRYRRDLRAQAVRAQDRLALVETWSWEEAGPAGIDNPGSAHWQGVEPIGALVTDVVVHQSSDDLSIATIMGGVWHSPIGGNGWIAQTDDLDSLGFGALAIYRDGGGNEVLYAASGSTTDENNDQIQSLGIARSIDGGATWTILDGGPTASRFIDRDVNRMIAFDRDRLLVATDQGLFYSADGGRNFGTSPDYRDGRPVAEGRITDLKSGTVGGNEVFWFAKARHGLYEGRMPPDEIRVIHRAESVESTDGVGLILFDRVESGGDTTWVMGATKHGDWDHYHSLQYRPARDSWRKLLPGGASPPYNGVEVGQTGYNHLLTLDPDDVTRSFLGLVSLFRVPVPTAAPAAGWSVTELSKGKIHADQHTARWDTTTTPSRLYVGNDGGVYRSEDGGATWTNLNQTLRANLVYGMDVARRGTGWEVLVGMQDTGTAYGSTTDPTPTVGNWSWAKVGGGDGGELALQPETGLRALHFTNEKVKLGTRANTGDAFAWGAAQLGGADFVNDAFRFSGVVAWARNATGDWNDAYVGFETGTSRGRLYRSTDGGSNFAHLRPTVGGSAVDDFEAEITVIRTASSDPAREGDAAPPAWSHVWVGLINGKVGRSTDGGATFTFTTPGPALPVTALAVDPTNSNRVAVGLSGFTGLVAGGRTAHVWLTTDGGATWNDIGGEHVPDLPVYSLVFSRTNPVALFLGNDAGVLVTTDPDLGAQWRRVGLGLPRVRANALRVVDPVRTDPPAVLDDQNPPELFVGTHGRSVYRLTRPAGGRLSVAEGLSFGTRVGGSPVDRTLTLRNVGGTAFDVTNLSVDAPFSVQAGGGTPFTLAPGAARDLTIRFQPGAEGVFRDYLNIFTDLPGVLDGHELVGLSGERVAGGPPRLGLDPILVGIPRGAVAGGRLDVPVRVTNGGLSDLSITEIVRTGSTRFEVLAGDGSAVALPLLLAPGEERELVLRLDTADAFGHESRFEFRSDDPVGSRTLRAQRPGPRGPDPAPAGPVADSGFPTWATVLIVIGAIALVVAGGVLLYDHFQSGDESPPPPPEN